MTSNWRNRIALKAPFNERRIWGPKPNYPGVLAWKPKPAGMTVVAGPCSVEDGMDLRGVVSALVLGGTEYARGGVYRAGTYPPVNFGLRLGLAKAWSKACRKQGLKVVMEVLDIRQAEKMSSLCDVFQVGARHMQDYALLTELSKYDRPVILKRNMGATLDEFLGAAEYLTRGRCTPILVERGSATHMNHVRWDLSISLIAAVKQMTKIPILVDASHGTGRRDLVRPMTLAGIAAGADGFIVEVHPDPAKSLSDADQAYPIWELGDLVNEASRVKNETSA